jgi:hypothetical protein
MLQAGTSPGAIRKAINQPLEHIREGVQFANDNN